MTALITGASRGLGAFIARRLAEAEPVVVNYASDSAAATRVVDEIIAAGGSARAYQADITDSSSVREMVDAVGPVRVVVANATGPQPLIPAEETTWEDHLRQLEFFVKSPALLMRAALPGMKQLGGGRIIMIGSDSFERALPLASAYNAAKGAQIGLARTWARELGRYGVTVNVVAPGWIPVERHGDADTAGYVADVPLGRIGTPEDIADVVAFVASDAARFVTGERITVNGGHTID
ncbi:SDR family oxidoreductase [Actinoplanes sp. NPDC048796]|uniref:SDR family oxidoreductase n=1 Tax=unclassified Actinoplanes TaxID=2626549 RepID=UPI0033D54745